MQPTAAPANVTFVYDIEQDELYSDFKSFIGSQDWFSRFTIPAPSNHLIPLSHNGGEDYDTADVRRMWRNKREVYALPLHVDGHREYFGAPYELETDAPRDEIGGFLWVEKERAAQEFKDHYPPEEHEKRALDLMRAELETLKMWMDNEIYVVIVERIEEDEDGDEISRETVNSCGGFFGYKYAKEEAERMLKDAREAYAETRADIVGLKERARDIAQFAEECPPGMLRDIAAMLAKYRPFATDIDTDDPRRQVYAQVREAFTHATRDNDTARQFLADAE